MRRNRDNSVSAEQHQNVRKERDDWKAQFEWALDQFSHSGHGLSEVTEKLRLAEDKLARIAKLVEQDTFLPAGTEDEGDRCEILIRPVRIREILGVD